MSRFAILRAYVLPTSVSFCCIVGRREDWEDEEVELAKGRRLYYFDSDYLDCSHWRFSAVTDPARPRCLSDLSTRVKDESPDHPGFISYSDAVQPCHNFLASLPNNGGTETTSPPEIAGIIYTKARLYEVISTVVSCLQDDSTKRIVGHRLKMSDEWLSRFLSLKFN